jgi:putative transposase
VGTVGDSYDNTLAESTIGQIKAELIKTRGPWRTLNQLEYTVFEYIDWWNHRRLHGEIGLIPPVEAEAIYYRQTRPWQMVGSQQSRVSDTQCGSSWPNACHPDRPAPARHIYGWG